jgi:ABC transporter substrate binding protein
MTSTVCAPPTTRSVLVAANPARANSANCSAVKPCNSMTALVQPAVLKPASSTSAAVGRRGRSRRRRDRGQPRPAREERHRLDFFFVEICAKRVELIKEAIPALNRIAVLINPANPSHLLVLPTMQDMASALGAELVPVETKGLDDIAATIATTTARGAQALVAIDDPRFISIARQIAELALQNSLPMIGFKPQAEAGALMDYGVDLADLYSRSAAFVDKILKGTPPTDLPIPL